MNLQIIDCEQGSDEWLQARVGIVTASNFSDILAQGKGLVRKKYLLQIVGERLSGVPYVGFRNQHTERGKEHEPISCLSYEAISGNMTTKVGFVRLIGMDVGCSPDAFVGDDGGLEMKNVIPSVQVETIERGSYPPEHKAQIQGNLWITGRKWWDFVSHSESIRNEKLRTYIFRVERDPDYITALSAEVKKFLDDANELINSLESK